MSPGLQQVARRGIAVVATGGLLLTAACSGRGEEASAAAGSDDSPLVVGISWALSGPLAVAAPMADGASAYFERVNAEGGVGGREIEVEVLDDAYDPARQADNARQLVEQDGADVVLTFGGISVAVAPYLNGEQVPHIVGAGQTPLSDVETTPYTRAWWPDIAWEGQVAAQHVLETQPEHTAGLIGLNNDLTPSQVEGIEAGGLTLDKVLTVAPGVVDLSSQVNEMRGAGVDVLFLSVGGAAQPATLRLMDQLDYHPTTIVYSSQADIKSTLRSAGTEAVEGILSTQYAKDPLDPRWADDEAVQQFVADITEYGDAENADNALALNGYGMAAAVVEALEGSDGEGGDAFMEAWGAISGVDNPALLPGVQLSDGPGGRLVHAYQMQRFDGARWEAVGDVVDAADVVSG